MFSQCNELLIETCLTHKDIDIIFNDISSQQLKFKQGIFFSLNKSRILFGHLPNLTSNLLYAIHKNGTCLSGHAKQTLVSLFRERRNVLIISVFGECMLVSKNDILEVLWNKIRRELINGNIIKRWIGRDVFMTLFVVDNSCYEEELDNIELKSTRITTGTGYSKREPRNKNVYNNNKKKREHVSTTRPIDPRQIHTTTVVDATVVDSALVAYPLHRQHFNKPKYNETNEEKFPTQVTEIDSGQPSFESKFLPRFANDSSNGQVNSSAVSTASDERHKRTDLTLVTSSSRIPLSLKPPRYPDFTDQQCRLLSFNSSSWAGDSKPDKSSLVACGFFYTGNQDLVRCFQCGIGLKDWTKEDDPMNEHIQHSTSCSFLVQKFGKHELDQMKRALVRGISDNNIDAVSTNPSPLQYPIRSPRYQTMEARIASFQNFPKQISISHQNLAVAGLFYTGQGDLCRCFTCDGGLKDWSSGDDPIKEHATYFPNCSYIIKLKGQEYVRLQQQGRTDNQQRGAEGGNNISTNPIQTLPTSFENMSVLDTNPEYSSFNVSQVVQKLGYAEIDVITAKAELERRGNKFPTAEDVVNTILDLQESASGSQNTPQSAENGNDVNAMVEENEKLNRLVNCMLCVPGEANILFLPCTHHRVCQDCSKDITYCPVCGMFVKQKVKTFRA
ncbi:baculoviral IAP repeat-containing protein 3-like [Ruditapes philippinarum]|uniref:baculoviral IAP repeat-containing protein 3-like n=1 Tax=Ruditapes philippinarum TaxID=129788 RepID=UPI00295ABE5B|nr:baculoviral IAP repeat-containing protein 3-like [Ruditapes philippinarum]